MAHSQGTLDDERLTWSVGRINAAVDRLAALTKDVLDLSRLRGGHLPFRPRPLELGSLLRDMEGRFIEVVGEQHQLVLQMPDEPCPVLVDHDRVEQIMINLLDNAAKYSPGGGEDHGASATRRRRGAAERARRGCGLAARSQTR